MTARWQWIALFGAYFLIQAIVRMFVGPALDLDEAEAFWFARELALGYNPQPPLYFWLQWGFFQIFGEGIAALALLKATLLWGAFSALFVTLTRAVPVAQAGVAVLAMGLLPQVLWEMQRTLTHSVLVFVMSVVFVAVFRQVTVRGRWQDYVALGLAMGFGMISKYNFALLGAGFLGWSLIARERRRIDWGRMAVSAGIAVAVIAPVAVWALRNREVAGGSVYKLGIEEVAVLAAAAEGMFSLTRGLLSFFALAIIALGGLWLFRERRTAARPDIVRYLAGGSATALAILTVGVLIAGVTEVRDRWLLPVAWPLVPAAVLWLWPVLSVRQRRGLGIGAGALWVVAMLALPYAALRDPGYRAADIAGLEAAIAAAGPADGVVVSDLSWVLGNLALRDDGRRLVWAGGDVDGAGVLITGPGAGVSLAEELGLQPGQPVAHEVTRGARTREVEIVPFVLP
jgi:4-amino-4-deoxy-L-arabinose transferase-like glycosyltransferase